MQQCTSIPSETSQLNNSHQFDGNFSRMFQLSYENETFRSIYGFNFLCIVVATVVVAVAVAVMNAMSRFLLAAARTWSKCGTFWGIEVANMWHKDQRLVVFRVFFPFQTEMMEKAFLWHLKPTKQQKKKMAPWADFTVARLTAPLFRTSFPPSNSSFTTIGNNYWLRYLYRTVPLIESFVSNEQQQEREGTEYICLYLFISVYS